jgi:hypothetical protein
VQVSVVGSGGLVDGGSRPITIRRRVKNIKGISAIKGFNTISNFLWWCEEAETGLLTGPQFVSKTNVSPFGDPQSEIIVWLGS